MSISGTFTEAELKKAVHSLLRNWQQATDSIASPLGELLIVRDGGHNGSLADRARQQVLETLILLAQSDSEGSAILRMRFIEGQTTTAVAYSLQRSVDQTNRLQRQALTDLTKLLLATENELKALRLANLIAPLPGPTYQKLYGYDSALQTLTRHLTDLKPPHIIAVVGLGGLGKTALIHAACQTVLPSFQYRRLVWVRFGHSHNQSPWEMLAADLETELALPPTESLNAFKVQLQRTLSQEPHLIVIDNLESEVAVQALFEHLPALAGSTRFLLASRVHPPPGTNGLAITLNGLNRTQAFALLREQAAHSPSGALLSADDAVLERIFERTGGHPLALKLVVGLTEHLPLRRVLEDLVDARPGQINLLYRHIYRQLWKVISPEAQQLLQAMPLVGGLGAESPVLIKISELPEGLFWKAVEELTANCLLEVVGGSTIDRRRYAIHRLTDSFLRAEIVNWAEDDE